MRDGARVKPRRKKGYPSMKRNPLPSLLAGLALASVCAAQDRPNILLILADDLGYGDVGCYNSEARVATPRMDRLAAEGMRFTDAHSPATVCTPTRYSLLTGRMAFRTGRHVVFTGAGGPNLIEEGRLTLPEMLRQKGYRTAMTGKWHVGLTFLDSAGRPVLDNRPEAVQRIDYARAIPDAPIHRGFDEFFGTACCPTTDWLYAFIDGDRIPVPPTGRLDRGKYPRNVYTEDFRDGFIAPDFDIEEVDEIFLRRSLAFLEKHARTARDRPLSSSCIPPRRSICPPSPPRPGRAKRTPGRTATSSPRWTASSAPCWTSWRNSDWTATPW
jgi:arylsulfatase A